MSRNSSDALTRSLLSQDMERQLSVSLVAVMIFYLLLGIILCQIKNYVHIALTQRRGDIKNHLVVGFLSLVTISKSILAGLDISRLVIENFGKPAAADAILDSDWIHLSGPISLLWRLWWTCSSRGGITSCLETNSWFVLLYFSL